MKASEKKCVNQVLNQLYQILKVYFQNSTNSFITMNYRLRLLQLAQTQQKVHTDGAPDGELGKMVNRKAIMKLTCAQSI